jgi:methylase of polypeptide subunit release factors
MKKQENILALFDFEEFKINLDDKNISKSKYHFLKNEIKGKINIDSIYFSGNYASVYFKTISSFSNENLKEVCRLHKSIWNQRKVPLLYISTPTELRIYNCFEEPIDPDKELNKINQIELEKYSTNDTKEHLNRLVSLLGRAAIDSVEFWKAKKIIQKFSPKKRVDNVLINNLKATKEELRKRKIDPNVIHDILTRSLFVLYLEDIGATNAEYYNQFKKGSKSYFHLLADLEATYKFFKHLDNKFNGNLFPVTDDEKKKINGAELQLIASCFWGNEVSSGQQTLWKKFDFSVIPIELLSEIYEIFLNNTDEEKSNTGEYYTPHSLVDLILNESLPWADKNNKRYDLKILDIACGSGIFLVESYRRLVDRWKYVHKIKPEFEDLIKILLNSIYGFEINPEAIKVASFSLYLTVISYLNPKTIWQKDEIKFPYLICEHDILNENMQGENLFRKSSLSNIIKHQPTFDLVLGNPPFKSAKTGSIEPEASEYCVQHGFAQEMVLPFLHRASQFCNETGKIAIISTSKILFNKSGGYKNFRQFLFNENYVEMVFNFSALRKPKKGQGKNIFAHAVGPACVLFYYKNKPQQQKPSITYVCPKPTERDMFSDDLVLDVLDFYYLPRQECQKPNTVIWKTAMWGTEKDFQLIQSLSEKKPLNQYLTEKNGWYKGVGLQFLTNNNVEPKSDSEIPKFNFVEAESIQKYYTTPGKSIIKTINEILTKKAEQFYCKYFSVSTIEELPKINIFRRLGTKEVNYAPHLLIKTGQSDKEFCASYIDYDCYFKHAIYGLSFKKDKIRKQEYQFKTDILKALSAIFNSKFASYYLFLSSISWGVEREQVQPNEMLSLPALPFEMPEKKVTELAQKVDEISAELANLFKDESKISAIENEIDEIIFKALNLTKREQYLIEDVLNYSLDLFQEGENSPAYFPVKQNNYELNAYLKILCEDINEHFKFSDTTVWASIWDMPATIPMRLVAIHSTNEHNAGHIHKLSNSVEINELIRTIDKYSYKEHSASVYFRKVVRYYKGDIIYIIKPNQKRFWSRSQAMQDSHSILLEIANLEYE